MQNTNNPYSPPSAQLAHSPGSEPAIPAGRGSRLGAVIVDGLILLAVCAPLVIVMAVGVESSQARGNTPTTAIVITAIGGSLTLLAAIGWLVYTIRLVSSNGQTIGKKLLGIKVVRSDGSAIGLGRIFWLRNAIPALIGAIPLLGSLFSLADPLMIFGQERRCLHDMIADTLVVQA